MQPGTYVFDTEDDRPDLAVVVARPDATIEEVTVTPPEGEPRSVADDNPDYPADSPAVVVSFVDSGLDEHWPEWTEAAPDELDAGTEAHGVRRYTFPEGRLQAVDVEAVPSDAPLDLTGLYERLDDAGWTVAVEGGILVAEKMGERYFIHPTADVDGEGDVRGPLENIVDQYAD